jgi:hypothetical protein
VALARWLTESDRGLYAVVMTFALFIEFGSQLGQRTALIYRIGRAGAARDVAVGAALALTLSALALVLAGCLLFDEPLRERLLAGAGADFLFVALALGAVRPSRGSSKRSCARSTLRAAQPGAGRDLAALARRGCARAARHAGGALARWSRCCSRARSWRCG